MNSFGESQNVSCFCNSVAVFYWEEPDFAPIRKEVRSATQKVNCGIAAY